MICCLRNTFSFLPFWIYSIANEREGFDYLYLLFLPRFLMGLDSPRPYNWYEDMDVWQKKTGAKMMGLFCLQLYGIPKEMWFYYRFAM